MYIATEAINLCEQIHGHKHKCAILLYNTNVFSCLEAKGFVFPSNLKVGDWYEYDSDSDETGDLEELLLDDGHESEGPFVDFLTNEATRHSKNKVLYIQSDGSNLEAFAARSFDPSLSWKDIAWLSITKLPFLMKGVLTREDGKVTSFFAWG
ncbi:peroxisomal (S)-2-hydroxy-acid oxidase GLO4-like protein [Tanacetum coccineum]